MLNRFDINSFVSLNSQFFYPLEKIKSSSQKIDDSKFYQLFKKSLDEIQKFFEDEKLQDLYINKSVSMFFLDKIGCLKGQEHPDTKLAKQFNFGPLTFASVEWIRYLAILKKNPILKKEVKIAIENWIFTESHVIPICLIFDKWICQNEVLVNLVHSLHNNHKIETTVISIQPPDEEVSAFTLAIANHIRTLKPGDYFKMPAGSLIHATRLHIQKNNDNTFAIIHFNTGQGAIQIDGSLSSACKYSSIHEDVLGSPNFWKQIVKAKMQPSMDLINDLLENLNNHPQNLNRALSKPIQESFSCSFLSVASDFKYSFISHFPSIENGWAEYKHCISLMTLYAKENETSSIRPNLARALFAKEKIRRRYLFWLSIVDDLEKVKKTQNSYIEAIVFLGKYSKENLLKLIENQTPLYAFNLLDRYLSDCLKNSSHTLFSFIQEKFGKDCTYNGVTFLGLREMMWIEYSRMLLREIVSSKELKGWVSNQLINLSSILLPNPIHELVQKELTGPFLEQKALERLLIDYIPRENPLISKKLLQDLVDNNLIAVEMCSQFSDVFIINEIEKNILKNEIDNIYQKIDEIKNDKHRDNLIQYLITNIRLNKLNVILLVDKIQNKDTHDSLIQNLVKDNFLDTEIEINLINKVKNSLLRDALLYVVNSNFG